MANRNLKVLRAKHDLTQQEVADKIGISLSQYNNKENGKSEFKQSEINKILNVFDEKYEDIFMPSKFIKTEQGGEKNS